MSRLHIVRKLSEMAANNEVKPKGKGTANRYNTQWASQFYVAAELIRRGYLAAFTLGNAPASDILVSSSSGKQFVVEVKALSRPNFWMFRRPRPRENLFYVFVALGKVGEQTHFCILTSVEAAAEYDEYRNGHGPTKWPDGLYGMKWRTAFKYENQWGKLPK